MWMIDAQLSLGDSRPEIYAVDDKGVVRGCAYFLADLLLWLKQIGIREVVIHSGAGNQVFRLDPRPPDETDTAAMPPGCTQLLEGTGKGPRVGPNGERGPPVKRPLNWQNTAAYRERSRLAALWVLAGPQPIGQPIRRGRQQPRLEEPPEALPTA